MAVSGAFAASGVYSEKCACFCIYRIHLSANVDRMAKGLLQRQRESERREREGRLQSCCVARFGNMRALMYL